MKTARVTNRNCYIVDASVGVKWLFREKMHEKAMAFVEGLRKKKFQIVVPEIFYSELASACWKRARKKIVSMEQAVTAHEFVMSLPLMRYSDHELSDVALENALQYQISTYDGLYITLAEIYLAPLVTADDNLLAKCQKRFEFIEHLADIEI